MTLQHLVMQLAVSGHLFCVSQHAQSLLDVSAPLPCIAFMQSDISADVSPDISPAAMLECVVAPPDCNAANADAPGAKVSDREISSANMMRTRFRDDSFKA